MSSIACIKCPIINLIQFESKIAITVFINPKQFLMKKMRVWIYIFYINPGHIVTPPEVLFPSYKSEAFPVPPDFVATNWKILSEIVSAFAEAVSEEET